MRATALALSLAITASCAALFSGCSSTTRASQEKPAPPVIEFLGAWGTKGDGPGALNDPRSIATDDFSAVYIADLGKPDRFINKFTRGGHPRQSFTPSVKFQDPCASAVDHSGMIYVLDCSTGVLYTLLLQDATMQHSMHTVSSKQKPVSVAVADDGRIYIASREALVTMFTPRGGKIGTLGKHVPEGEIFADQVLAAPDNTIYAASCRQPLIEQLDSNADTKNYWVAAAPSSAAANDICFLAATQKYIALLANVPSAPVLRIFAVAEKHEKLSKPLAEIDPSLINLNIKGMAATQDGELLILDAAAPRVLRFRLN